jgi:hypothetical protein
MKREHAWRVFATEFNDASFELKGEEKMAPSYVITPLGSKINRLFVVGVLTDVEQVSESGDFVRGHISDPTGVFTLYSGQFQPEVTDQLTSIEVPAFVAIVGKSKGYIPEDGDMLYASVRPERVVQVDAKLRDSWILETCKRTKERIEAMIEAGNMSENIADELTKLGFAKPVAEGIDLSLKRYEYVDIEKYKEMMKDALEYLTATKDLSEDAETVFGQKDGVGDQPEKKEKMKEEEKVDTGFEEIEESVLKVIKESEGEEGASWDMITEKCIATGLDENTIEEALNSLMDKGLIYEPVLGTIKTT